MVGLFWAVGQITAEEEVAHLTDGMNGCQCMEVIFDEDYKTLIPIDIFEKHFKPESRGMTFDMALQAMRLGKRVRRNGWMTHVGIEDRGNGVPLMVIRGPSLPEALTAYHPCSDDVLADDWEVYAP